MQTEEEAQVIRKSAIAFDSWEPALILEAVRPLNLKAYVRRNSWNVPGVFFCHGIKQAVEIGGVLKGTEKVVLAGGLA
ncbi:hypothetical protein [Flavobacterium nitrogenifigens]|uniref:hypothetical protein n=1 Tax=Flavobacterium nitrogenifigens TaxID=1617283 RepID=UPI000DABA39B|nr:hypothetical protein [Flavobacterium nitrogenifigens]KAF2337786.1 hypothetical protein DM397_03650 [Flavobacterium nitrogenifigens]